MSLVRPCIDKVRFLTEGAALRNASWTNAIKRRKADRLSDKRREVALRRERWIRNVYQCPHCGGWHLTSRRPDTRGAA